MIMKLQKFMGSVLDELASLRDTNQNKSNYLIDEMEFELHISEVTETNGCVNISVVKIGTETQTQNFNKVKIKLIPKKRQTQINKD